MFKTETKIKSNGDLGKVWRDASIFGKRFETEAQAWEFLASLDQDGFVPKALYRVVAV